MTILETGVRVFLDYLQSQSVANKDFPALCIEQRYCQLRALYQSGALHSCHGTKKVYQIKDVL